MTGHVEESIRGVALRVGTPRAARSRSRPSPIESVNDFSRSEFDPFPFVVDVFTQALND